MQKRRNYRRKQEQVALGRSAARLAGWVRHRVEKSSKPWITVNVGEFCKMSGLSLRTTRRALNQVRESVDMSRCVLRTVNRAGRWQVIGSTPERLHGLARSEPFLKDETGKTQLVKLHKQGPRVTEEQLRVGEAAAYWGAEYTKQQDIPEQPSPKEHPKQLKMAYGAAGTPHRMSKCHFSLGSIGEAPRSQRKKHGQGPRLNVKQLRLAHFLARGLQRYHWDNCKVRWQGAHCYVYAKWALERGCKRGQINRAWDIALHQMHAEAVDQGEVGNGVWPPSSTMTRAKRILERSGCFGTWN